MSKLLVLILLVVGAMTLPYQAHGFNDMEYFVQLLKKGVRTFKMDLSLLSKKSCVEQSTWQEGDNNCFILKDYAQQLCCLGFRGDTSSTPEVRYPFNTTKQFLNVLARADLQVILREKIFLAINFQYTDSQNAITKKFLVDILKTIEIRGLGITLATGTDNIILDYDYQCIIQGKCDADAKYISDSNIVLQSSDPNPFHPHDAKKRYRNFNVFYKAVQQFCKDGFPLWVDKYDYPIIFWQPSNEDQIQYVLSTFLSSTCKRPANHNTINQIAIASNLQPQMFQIYAQGNGINYGVGQKISIENITNPLLTTLTVNGVQHFLFGYQNTVTKNWRVDLVNSSNTNQTINSINFIEEKLINIKGSDDTFLAIVEKSSGGQAYRLYNTSLQYFAQFNGTPPKVITYNKRLAYYIKQVKQGTYNWASIDVATGAMSITGCALDFKVTNIAYLDTLYIVGVKNGQTYLSKNCTETVKLSFGQDAAITASDGQLYIIQQSGMCQSAVLLNNNEVNKCNFYTYPEFFSLRNVPSMITYIAGTPENIFNETKNAKPISGCSSSVYSSKLANGKNVSPVSFNGKLYLAYEYVPISKQPLITTLFCGASNFDNKLDSSIVQVSYIDALPLTINKQILLEA